MSRTHVTQFKYVKYSLVSLKETISQGPFVMRTTCRACGGERKVITNKCIGCYGQGKVRNTRNVVAAVPAGILVIHPCTH